jgi:hypothetical protein
MQGHVQRPCDRENENRCLKLGHNFHSPFILSTRILQVVQPGFDKKKTSAVAVAMAKRCCLVIMEEVVGLFDCRCLLASGMQQLQSCKGSGYKAIITCE